MENPVKLSAHSATLAIAGWVVSLAVAGCSSVGIEQPTRFYPAIAAEVQTSCVACHTTGTARIAWELFADDSAENGHNYAAAVSAGDAFMSEPMLLTHPGKMNDETSFRFATWVADGRLR